MASELPVTSFRDRDELREWLTAHHDDGAGVWVRIFRARSGIPSVTFDEVLAEGLCFGWSESTRRAYDATSYLQRFTPRSRPGTASERNRALVERLVAEGRMTPAGLAVLDTGP
jgi:uncharacterized protein YdeI (YjbR/CyaY-like superfamily)